MPWELSSLDLHEEAEDIEALAELERAKEGSSDNDSAGEEDEVIKVRRLFNLKPQSVFFF